VWLHRTGPKPQRPTTGENGNAMAAYTLSRRAALATVVAALARRRANRRRAGAARHRAGGVSVALA
jgi:hypothetical protein